MVEKVNKEWETLGLGDSHFHSNREERHILGGKTGKKEKKGFFQKNPGMKIVLLDILFIIIISGVIVPFIYKREGRQKFDNYNLVLKAFTYDDEILAVLTITARKDSEFSGLIEAGFFLEGEEIENVESDLLPSEGEERILRTRIKYTDSEYIYCNVKINGKNKTIKGRIR